jgi:hypothetical protein
MREIVADTNLVARCGLYCGACKRYLKGGCAGCTENAKASWCKVRTCCIEHEYSTCADCQDFDDPKDCAKYNAFIARMFGLIFRSDRRACIMQIKENGTEAYAQTMAASGAVSLRR